MSFIPGASEKAAAGAKAWWAWYREGRAKGDFHDIPSAKRFRSRVILDTGVDPVRQRAGLPAGEDAVADPIPAARLMRKKKVVEVVEEKEKEEETESESEEEEEEEDDGRPRDPPWREDEIIAAIRYVKRLVLGGSG